ncbi:TetR/AcrR family transcriptional regulator [Paenibacillus kandeliae]|uniref:TetR/AcrR family transcriptional regulator n=1 Tax=Paenibacillus kandeliae TaxID=3231269 RepID=UPI00345A5399
MVSTIDRRVRKSQEAIKKAMTELLAEQNFDQITIQDIADKADVSRRTIYLHYTDKFDLLDKLIEEHMDELHQLCESTEDDVDYTDPNVLVVWFEYLESHALFFSAMLASTGSPFFRNRFLEFFLRELEKGSDQGLTDGVKVDIQFLGAAIVGVVEWWFKTERSLSTSFMAERVGMLLGRNVKASLPLA